MSAPRVPDVRDGLPWCSQHCPHYKNAALRHWLVDYGRMLAMLVESETR